MSDDDLMPVTREMLRRWELTLKEAIGGGVHEVRSAMRAVLADADSSPDPEGAEAAVLAPESETAKDAEK